MKLSGGHIGQLVHGLRNLVGGRDAGVADAEVENLVFADLGLALKTVREQLANCRRGVAQTVHGFVDHGVNPPNMSQDLAKCLLCSRASARCKEKHITDCL